MPKQSATPDKKRRSSDITKLLKLLAAAIAIAAVIKELRLPKEERTWHGAIAGFVPYDFRKPSVERIKRTFWDPDGRIVVDRPFGVGWTVNVGAVVGKIRSLPKPTPGG